MRASSIDSEGGQKVVRPATTFFRTDRQMLASCNLELTSFVRAAERVIPGDDGQRGVEEIARSDYPAAGEPHLDLVLPETTQAVALGHTPHRNLSRSPSFEDKALLRASNRHFLRQTGRSDITGEHHHRRLGGPEKLNPRSLYRTESYNQACNFQRARTKTPEDRDHDSRQNRAP